MSTINSSATITLQANGQQVEQTLTLLKKRAFDLENALAKAAAAGNRTDMKKIQRELKQTNRQIRDMSSSAEEAERVLRQLDKATPRELREALRTLNKQLERTERGSVAWDEQTKKIRRLRAELDRVNGELREGEGFWARFNRTMNDWQTTLMAGAAAVTGLVMAGRSAVNAYAAMDAEMANVRKFTGMTAEEVLKLNEELKQIDTRSSREELNRLAQEAGRLGKTSQEDVLGFVRAADQINVALDDLGSGATLTLSKLTDIFGDEKRLGTERSLLAVGSVINELSQNCTASAPYLAEFAQRMAGVGAQAGMTIPQLMAFGAVLDSQGQAVEMSGTALSKLVMDLFKQTEKIAAATGLELDEFKEALARSTNEGLLMLLQRLHDLGGMDVLAPIFKDMGEEGARASSVISALAKNIDTLKWQQEQATAAFNEATSVTNEFNVQNTTVQAELDKAKKRVTELAIELGEKLKPVMSHVISSTTLLLKAMSSTITFIGANLGTLATLTAMIAAYTLAVNAANLTFKAHYAWVVATTAAAKAYHFVVKSLHAAHLLLQIGVAKLNGNWARQSALMIDLKKTGAALASGWGILLAAAVALGAALYKAIQKAREASEAEKALADIRRHGAEAIVDQKLKIEALIAVAQDETRAMDERQRAAKELNAIIPNYNAQLDATTGRYKASKQALDDYLQSLVRLYEIEGAKDKLKAVGKEIADLTIQKWGKQEEKTELETKAAKAAEQNKNHPQVKASGRSKMDADVDYIYTTADQTWNKAIEGKQGEINSLQAQIDEKRKTVDTITNAYGKELQDALAADNVPETTRPAGDTGGGLGAPAAPETSSHAGGAKPDPKAERSQELQAWREREEAINRIAYATGERDYEAYTSRLQQIAIDFYQKQLERQDLSSEELLAAEADYHEAVKAQTETADKKMLENEKQRYAEEVAVLRQRYADGLSTKSQYEAATEQAELAHLRRMVQLTVAGGKERAAAEKAYDERRIADREKRRKEAERRQAELAKVKEDYFGMNAEERQAQYNKTVQALEQVYQAELRAAGDNAAEKLRIEEAYQKAKVALGKKYDILGLENSKNALEQANADLIEWLNSEAGQAVTQSFSTIVSGLSDIFAGVSSLVQAELDLQTAAIEKRYDKEMAAAEGNTYKLKKLEAQKQKDLAKAKNEANKKLFAMQVIQAVAQTAQNALSAYGSAAAIPVVGYILAPIAAAMAVAAGAIQIAAIKKQQQASEAQGYAEGGFTPKGDRLEPVGVVHAGEWVAPQRLVNSPQTRPLIDALETARRTNVLGSLSMSDVSALNNPTAAPAPPVIVQQPSAETNIALSANARAIAQMQSTLSKLNKRLAEPFVTVNTVEGDEGIKKAQDDYSRLMKNKAPKNRL